MPQTTACPFLLRPSGKDYIWGGRRLNDEFAKNIDLSPLAETWECSTHPDGPSYAATGPFKGMMLSEILREHPEYLGRHAAAVGAPGGDVLPVLVKLIDARQDLSVQVHPDDAYAAAHEGGQRGKNEMWYVLDAARDAKLVCGLRRTLSAAQLRCSLADGTLQRELQIVPAHKNDVFFIPAGTVHAIGAGALIAEIQESSNLTYRLYDYDRVDRNGQKRALHIDKALDAASLTGAAAPRQPMRVLRYHAGCAEELLCRCRSFEVHRLLINTERIRAMVPFAADAASFRVLLCVDGCGVFTWNGAAASPPTELTQALPFYKGDCLFVPASASLQIHACAQFLDVRC